MNPHRKTIPRGKGNGLHGITNLDSHIYTKEEGANAIVGLDMETSDMGGEASFITLVSATGTAVIVEEE